MTRKWKAAIVLALVGGCIVAPAGGARGGPAQPTVSVLKVFVTGGNPPSVDRVGQVSATHGELRDTAGNLIGSWRLRCTYFGGSGMNGETSHFCKHVATFGSRGSILSEGGIAWATNAVQWSVITGGTGAYRGVFGAVRIASFNTPTTPTIYYLIRR